MPKMFVWRALSELRDYADGLLCVIATSRTAAVEQAVKHLGGTHKNEACDARRAKIRSELMTAIASPDSGDAYEEISIGCAALRGSS